VGDGGDIKKLIRTREDLMQQLSQPNTMLAIVTQTSARQKDGSILFTIGSQ